MVYKKQMSGIYKKANTKKKKEEESLIGRKPKSDL